MTETAPHVDRPAESRSGMARLSAGMWLALGAAALQVTAIASDFYAIGEEGTVADAWFGIPHTSQLILASALVTMVLAGLVAADRSPLRGRNVGLVIGIVGLLATAQLVYRMFLPPFGGCLTYIDCTAPRASVDLLPGIWFGLAGCIGATIGGFGHAASARARQVAPRFWVARDQQGVTPWLSTAAVAAIVAFLVGYAGFGFYKVIQGEGSEATEWSGWIATPHTSSFVLLLAAVTVALVWAAARRRSPMGPAAMGGTIAALGFAAATRILYRILVPPFYSGRPEGVFQEGAEIQLTAWIALAAAVVWCVAGLVEALAHRQSISHAPGQPVGERA